MTPARWLHSHLEHGIRASTPDCWLQVVGRASSVLVDLRGSRQGPSHPLLPRKARFKLTLSQVCCRSGGRCCWPCWCRSHVSLLQVVSLPLVPGSMCACWAGGEGAVALLVRKCDLHSRAPQAHLLVACWCSQRGLRRTICHPAAVMIPSVLPCRPLGLLWSHHSLLPPAGCVTLC